MKYVIKNIRSKDIAWSGGTFKKFEVKTQETGDEILELRFGQKMNPKIKVGDTVEGYLDNSTFMSRNGLVTVRVLKRIDADYVYKLLLKKFPDIEKEENEDIDGEMTLPDDIPLPDEGF